MRIKNLFIFLVLAVLDLTNTKAENVTKLTDALQAKNVSISLSGAKPDTSFRAEYSSHYGPCMALEISNSTSETLTLNLDYGYKLEPIDSTLQTMLVTQTLIAKLAPRQKKTYRIYAMCTEASDGSPSSGKIFDVGRRTTGSLLALAELLNRKKYQGNAAQDAVWCLTDNHNVYSIFSDDTMMMYELRRFVARVKGIPVGSIYTSIDETTERESVKTFTTRTVYSGSLSYSMNRSSKVLIALFDESNNMKRVYVNNETQREGEFTYRYQISSAEMENKKHYLRMFRDGKLEQEISIIPRN